MELRAATGADHPTIHQDSGEPEIEANHAFAMALGPNGSYYLLYTEGTTVKCLKTTDLKTRTASHESDEAGVDGWGPAICRDGGTYWIAYAAAGRRKDPKDGNPFLVGETSDPSASLPMVDLRADSRQSGKDHFSDVTTDGQNKYFPDTDKPVGCCVYQGQPVFAFKRAKHEVALIWNTLGTWHHMPSSTDPDAEYRDSMAIPNPDGYVDANGNHHGAEWVVTSRSPACTSVTLDGQERFFLASKENGGSSLWAGHVFEPGNATSWPKDTLSPAKVGDTKLRSEVAPGVVEYKGDVLMVFSNKKDEDQNRLWLALFDGGDLGWETAYRLLDDQGETLPKPSQSQLSNINLLVDHGGDDVLLSYSDGEKIRLYRLKPTET